MIFLDTSAIYAMADRADPNHERAKERFEGLLNTALAFDADFEAEGFHVL